jgi:predicted lipid carrier protein YhbT
MPVFLSDEWFDAMAAAARCASDVSPDLDLVVQQVVEPATGPDGEIAWFVTVRDGTVGIERGRHPSPSIAFTLDIATAAGIQSGEQSAQAAFMAGRLRVGGDVRTLLDQQEAMATLEDVFADVRATTTYGS